MKKRLAWYGAVASSLLIVLAFLCVLPVRAADSNHQVLVINSYSYDSDEMAPELKGLSAAMRRDMSPKYLFMDVNNRSAAQAKLELRARMDTWNIRSTFDGVIVADDAALDFVLQYREDYFSGLPIVFMGVNHAIKAAEAAKEPLIAGVEERMPFRETIALAQKLRPKATQVVCLNDGSESARGMLGEYYALDSTFPDLEFTSLCVGEMTEEALRSQLEGYGEETILIYSIINFDGDGNSYTTYQAGEMLSQLTDIPIFTILSESVGSGVLGGYGISRYNMAYTAAELMHQVLDGKASIAEHGVTPMPVYAQFDKLAMDQLGISKSMLPADTQYVNDAWGEILKQHRELIVSVAAILAVLMVATLLLLGDNRRRRVLIRRVKDREGQLQSLMDLVPAGICTFRVDGEGDVKEVHFNAGFYQLLGFTPEQMPDTPLEIFHPEVRCQMQRILQAYFKNGKDIQETLRVRRGDGSYIWMSLRAVPYQMDQGDARLYYGVFSDVDELQRMQETLKENEHTLQVAMSHANVECWRYDSAGQNGDGASRVETFLKERKKSPARLDDTTKLMEKDAPKLEDALAAIDGGAESALCEVRVRTADGETRWKLIKMTALYDDKGRRSTVVCTAIDTTEHHQDIERYKRQTGRLRAALPNTVAAFQINVTKNTCAPFGVCSYPELLEKLDGTADTLLRQMRRRSANQEQAQSIKARFSRKALAEMYEHGVTVASYDCCCQLDGAYRWITIRTDMTHNPSTRDLEASIYFFDIDAQKAMEQVMDIMLRREYLMIMRINLPVDTARVFSSQDGQNFVHEMPNAEETLLGSIRHNYAGDDLEKTLRRFRFSEVKRQLEEKGEYSIFTACTDRRGRVHRLRNSFAWLDRDSGILCYAMADVTDAFEAERKRNEALQAAVEDARRASQAKSDFLSRMSHEIRTPMNVILNLAQLSLDLPQSGETEENLRKIRASGEYLLGLINDVLDMSRIETGHIELHPEDTNVREFFKTLEDIIGPRMKEKDIRFRLDADVAGPPYVVIDPLRMRQVYINILNNAIKFSQRGKEISCAVTHVPCGEDKITSTITIRDHGCGMSKEFVQRAFEPFEQEHNPYQDPQAGTGLGLAIVKNLVEQMGGTVELRSELGRGTEFTVRLTVPIGKPPEAPALEPERESSLRGRRVLLAEDHPINTEIAKKLLMREGMLVDHVTNGRQAVERYLEKDVGYYSAILMDIRMPEMNGIKAAEAIRASARRDAKTIPIIAMTANAFDRDRRETRSAGMNAHLAKPIRAAVLLDTLRRLIGSG